MVWKDDGAVIMASNCFGSEPIQKAKRWDRKENKEVSVDMAYVVHKHNTSMGGTDCQDQNVNKYRISIRSGGCLCFHGEQMSQHKMPGCCFVQVLQDGVCLSLENMLLDICSK